MQLTQHGVMHLQEVNRWCDSVFLFSHTFVVWVNSLRTVDLTRNMTAGEGTGQVNINPDKSTMAGWNFDRIMGHIINITHRSNTVYNPGEESTHTQTELEQNVQRHTRQQEMVSHGHK